MNVVLPEKNRIKKKQLFIYISIIIICIISVIIAFYVQFYTRIDILLLLLKHKEINYHTKYKKLYQEVFNYLTNQKQIVSSCNYLVNAFYIEFVK